MMNNFKIAFFDIDGTLFDHKHHCWIQSSIDAINKLQEKGVKCFVCTARSFYSAKRFGILNCGIKWDGGIYAAGATGIVGSKVFYTDSIPPKQVKKFVSLMHSKNVTVEIVGTKSTCYSKKINDYVREYRKNYVDKDPRVFKNYYKNVDNIVTCFLTLGPKEIDPILKREFPNIYMFRYHPYAVDCKWREYQKGDGVKKALSYYGFKKEESIGFGDEIQDISVAENVGTFIAVGDSREELQKVASKVCKPIFEDGIALFLKESKLI